MASSKVAISLPEELLRLIDADRTRLGLSRSEYVRRAVERGLGSGADRKAAAAALRGMFASEQGSMADELIAERRREAEREAP